MNTKVMVYIQCDVQGMPINTSLEALSKVVSLSKEDDLEVVACVIGTFNEATEKACREYGVTKVLVNQVGEYHLQIHGEVLAKLVEKYKPSMVFAGASPQGKEMTAYVASKIEGVALTNVMDLETTGELEFTVALYGGAVLRKIKLPEEKTKFIVFGSGAFKKIACPSDAMEIIQEDFPEAKEDVWTQIQKRVTEIAETVNLEEAEVIVACGRGMATEEGMKLVEELADVVGGVIGATRPVTESGLVAKNQQVGQSGKIISPKLYIGCGVSGAVQHLSGILGSDYIVAINKDEDAPIFDVADVGMVGDGMKILPLFIEEIKKIKG